MKVATTLLCLIVLSLWFQVRQHSATIGSLVTANSNLFQVAFNHKKAMDSGFGTTAGAVQAISDRLRLHDQIVNSHWSILTNLMAAERDSVLGPVNLEAKP